MDRNSVIILGSGLFVLLFLATLFSIWMIDVSVGAASVDGCVTHGTDCIPPMVAYHKNLWILIGCVVVSFILLEIFLISLLCNTKDYKH